MSSSHSSSVQDERRLALLKLLEAAEGLVLHAANQAALFDEDLEFKCDDIAGAISRVRHG